MLLPDEDVARVARELETQLSPRVAALPRSPRARVEVYAYGPGGGCPETAEIVRLATAAWRDEFGDAPAVREWSGATDGGIFLARDIPTARMGPQVTRDPADPRLESVSLDELVKAARAHAAAAVAFFRAT
jgi:acetylornithine deacetylase/succinyl-diaminopimelate desuccinylase-like protein